MCTAAKSSNADRQAGHTAESLDGRPSIHWIPLMYESLSLEVNSPHSFRTLAVSFVQTAATEDAEKVARANAHLMELETIMLISCPGLPRSGRRRAGGGRAAGAARRGAGGGGRR